MKLTHAIRATTVANILKRAGIAERRDEVKTKLGLLGQLIYNEIVAPTVPAAIREAWNTTAGRAQYGGWVYTSDEFRIKDDVEGFAHYTYYRKDEGINQVGASNLSTDFTLPSSMPFRLNQGNIEILGHEKLRTLAQEVVAYHRETNELERKLRSGASALLNSVTTINKLLEIWPEASAVLPITAPTTGALVPIETIASLNKQIGL